MNDERRTTNDRPLIILEPQEDGNLDALAAILLDIARRLARERMLQSQQDKAA